MKDEVTPKKEGMKMMNKTSIVTTKRVVLFADVHNFSIAAKILGENQYRFIQELYEVLGDIVVSQDGEL